MKCAGVRGSCAQTPDGVAGLTNNSRGSVQGVLPGAHHG